MVLLLSLSRFGDNDDTYLFVVTTLTIETLAKKRGYPARLPCTTSSSSKEQYQVKTLVSAKEQ